MSKLLIYNTVLFIVLLLSSCNINESKAIMIVNKFLEAIDKNNEDNVKKYYQNFTGLIKYNEKVYDAHYLYEHMDSVVCFDLSDTDIELQKSKYKKMYNLDLAIDKGFNKLYVIHYGVGYDDRNERKIRFEVEMSKDSAQIIRSFNYFLPKNKGTIAKDPLEVSLHYTCQNDIENERVISTLVHKLPSLGSKVFSLYSQQDYDSLALLYPGIKDIRSYVSTGSGILEKIKLGFNLPKSSKKESGALYSFETVFYNEKGDSILSMIWYANRTIETTPERITPNGCIINSLGLYYWYDIKNELEKKGAKFSENFDLLTDKEIVEKIRHGEEQIELINKKRAKRAKYEKMGLVLLARNTTREANTTGYSYTVFNPTNKTIKYVTACMTAMNAVNEICGFTQCNGIGPLWPHTSGVWKFPDAFTDPNQIIDRLDVVFKVKYDDGTEKLISEKTIFMDEEFSESLWFEEE